MSPYAVKRTFHIQEVGKNKQTIRRGSKPKRVKTRILRISKLMALAISYDKLIRTDQVADMATLARYGQVTRARMTQIMNLLLLAPDIQEEILFLPETAQGRDSITLRQVMPITLEADWGKQREIWEKTTNEFSCSFI